MGWSATTLRELEMESDTMDAQNPMKASRASHTMRGCLGGSVRTSDRKLYYQDSTHKTLIQLMTT